MSLRDGEGLRDAGALDDEVVVGLVRLAELAHRLEEVAAQRAADAAVVQLHHLRLLLHQLVLLDLLRVDVDAPCPSKESGMNWTFSQVPRTVQSDK